MMMMMMMAIKIILSILLCLLSLSKSLITSTQISTRYHSDWGDLELVTLSANPLLFWYIVDEIDTDNNDINYENLFSAYKSNTLYGLRLKNNNDFWYNSTIDHDKYFCKDSYFLLPMFCSTDISNEMTMIWVKDNIRRQGHATAMMKLLDIEKVSGRFIDEESKKFFDSCQYIGNEYNHEYQRNIINNNDLKKNDDNNSKYMLTSITASLMASLYGELKRSNFIEYRTNVLNAFYDDCLYGLRTYCDGIEDNVYCDNRDNDLLPLFCAVYEEGVCGLIWTAKRARKRGFATEIIKLLNINTVDSPMSNDNAIGLWNKLNLNVKGDAEYGYYEKMKMLNPSCK